MIDVGGDLLYLRQHLKSASSIANQSDFLPSWVKLRIPQRRMSKMPLKRFNSRILGKSGISEMTGNSYKEVCIVSGRSFVMRDLNNPFRIGVRPFCINHTVI